MLHRTFCRIGMEEKVPDAKMLVRLGQAVGPEAIGELHDRMVEIARVRKVGAARCGWLLKSQVLRREGAAVLPPGRAETAPGTARMEPPREA